MDAETRKTLDMLRAGYPTTAAEEESAQSALDEIDALRAQVTDLEARAIPKAMIDHRGARYLVELCWHPNGAGIGGVYVTLTTNGGARVEWTPPGGGDTLRTENFPTLAAALASLESSDA